MNFLLAAAIFQLCTCSAHARLRVSPAGSACAGQEINFSCRRDNSQGRITFLRWTVADLSNQLIFTSNSDSQTGTIPYNGHVFLGILYSTTPEFFSTLTTTADAQLNGVNVECLTDNNLIRETLLINVLANTVTVVSPVDLQLIVINNGSHTAEVLLQWTSPAELSHETNYTSEVTIYNSFSTQSERFLIQHKNSDAVVNVSLNLQYNINYTVSVLLIDTCIDSNSSAIQVQLVNCSIPLAASDVVIDPYTKTTEGAEVYFYCDQGFYPTDRIKAVCDSNKTWTPDPIHHVCFRVLNVSSICGPMKAISESLPSILQNDVVAAAFHCNDGGKIPSGEFNATCICNNYQLQCFPDVNTSPVPGSNGNLPYTPTISTHTSIAITLSCSTIFALIGGLIGLVCGIRCTIIRQHAATSEVNATLNPSQSPEEIHHSQRQRQFEFTENIAYASINELAENVAYASAHHSMFMLLLCTP